MAERKKKPKFRRKDWNKKPKLGKGRKNIIKWVRPRGRHNKLREKRKGHGKGVIIGYSQPKEIRGKIQGLQPKIIFNTQQLEKLDKTKEIAIIAAVGTKKKIALAEKAKELGVEVTFNLDKFLEKAKKDFEERKAKRKDAAKERKEKEEKAKKKVKETKEEKKTEEQKEKDKKAEQEMLLKKTVEKERHLGAKQKAPVIKRKALEK